MCLDIVICLRLQKEYIIVLTVYAIYGHMHRHCAHGFLRCPPFSSIACNIPTDICCTLILHRFIILRTAWHHRHPDRPHPAPVENILLGYMSMNASHSLRSLNCIYQSFDRPSCNGLIVTYNGMLFMELHKRGDRCQRCLF